MLVKNIKMILKNKLFLLSILIFSFIIFGFLFITDISNFLIFERPCLRADVILVLSGGVGERIEEAVNLYHKGYAPKILMGGGGEYFGRYYTDFMGEYANELGVRKKDILKERQALSTYENATYSLPILKELKAKKVLLVTSKFHTSRAYKIFQKVFQKSNIEIYIVGVDDEIDYQRWWQNHEMSQKILIELGKTFVYWIKY